MKESAGTAVNLFPASLRVARPGVWRKAGLGMVVRRL